MMYKITVNDIFASLISTKYRYELFPQNIGINSGIRNSYLFPLLANTILKKLVGEI